MPRLAEKSTPNERVVIGVHPEAGLFLFRFRSSQTADKFIEFIAPNLEEEPVSFRIESLPAQTLEQAKREWLEIAGFEE